MPPEAVGEARQARDVMAFGQEVGRVLSDGRIVGRAEPFAKVFPSSRLVKRAVGLAAWGVLEDIAVDAQLDGVGRLVAETNLRRIAANLGLNKDTVTKHLRALREHGFVLQEQVRGDASGRYETARYVLDPSACVERFTHTPAPGPVASGEPCPSSSDTVQRGSVSGDTGHGGTGHGDLGQPPLRDVDVVDDQEQQRAAVLHGGLAGRLAELGVAEHVAADLLGRYPPDRLRDAALVAAGRRLRNPAAWLVAALRDGWDLTRPLGELRAAEAQRALEARQAAEAARRREADVRVQARTDGWTAAVSAALDDRQLALALARVTTPVPGVGRRSVHLAQAQLVGWAIRAASERPDLPFAEALETSLSGVAQPVELLAAEELPDPPAGHRRPDLTARIRRCLPTRSFPPDPTKEHTREPDTRSAAR